MEMGGPLGDTSLACRHQHTVYDGSSTWHVPIWDEISCRACSKLTVVKVKIQVERNQQDSDEQQQNLNEVRSSKHTDAFLLYKVYRDIVTSEFWNLWAPPCPQLSSTFLLSSICVPLAFGTELDSCVSSDIFRDRMIAFYHDHDAVPPEP